MTLCLFGLLSKLYLTFGIFLSIFFMTSFPSVAPAISCSPGLHLKPESCSPHTDDARLPAGQRLRPLLLDSTHYIAGEVHFLQLCSLLFLFFLKLICSLSLSDTHNEGLATRTTLPTSSLPRPTETGFMSPLAAAAAGGGSVASTAASDNELNT
jgi:hypothetical protein